LCSVEFRYTLQLLVIVGGLAYFVCTSSMHQNGSSADFLSVSNYVLSVLYRRQHRSKLRTKACQSQAQSLFSILCLEPGSDASLRRLCHPSKSTSCRRPGSIASFIPSDLLSRTPAQLLRDHHSGLNHLDFDTSEWLSHIEWSNRPSTFSLAVASTHICQSRQWTLA
jgi:hypothetical protein